MLQVGDKILLGAYTFRVNRIKGDFATITWLSAGVTYFKIVRINKMLAVLRLSA